MSSNLKHIYQKEFNNSNYELLDENISSEINDLDIPRGWSFICLDETINYYKDTLNKDNIDRS